MAARPALARLTADPPATTPVPSEADQLAAEGGMSVSEAQAFLGLSSSELYNLMNDGSLAYAKLGRRRLLSRVSVRRYLAERMVVEE